MYKIIRTFSGLLRFSYPKVMINSIPKSGTNLLLRAFSNLHNMRDAGMGTITDMDWAMRNRPRKTFDECLLDIGKVRHGEYLTAHLSHDRRLSDYLREHNIAHVLIVRDPRDIVVSTALYIVKEKGDKFHDYFFSLKSHRDRIMAAIKGVSGDVTGGLVLPSIVEFFKRSAPWLDDERCLVVRFEDLVGPSGGGDEKTQSETVKKIMGHVGLRVSKKYLPALAEEVFSRESRTFRKGAIGGWKEWLDEELMEMLVREREAFRPFGYDI